MAPPSPPTAKCSPSTCPNVQPPLLLPQEYVVLNGEQPLQPSQKSVFSDDNLPPLPPQVVTAPFEYVSSLPGKGRRILFTTALNRWLNVSEADVHDTNHIIDILHNVSLMIDDIQDNASQRRGHPSTHMVFGTAQTINSAMFYINEATSLVQRLCGPEGVQVLLEQMKLLYMGQGYDVNSSQTMRCPTTEEYIRIIDGKTGGLLELNARLLVLKAKSEVNYKVIRRLVVLFGRFYQIRDDYTSVQSPTKGRSEWHKPAAPWCEDLDEGKYTLPVIHLLQSKQDEHLVQNILSTRHMTGKMDELTKRLFLDCLQRAGSMEYTYEILQMVHKDFLLELDRVNTAFGSENQAMRSLIDALQKDEANDGLLPDSHYLKVNINSAWSRLDEYYTKLDETPIYYAVIALHPAFRWEYLEMRWHEHREWISYARVIVRTAWEDSGAKQTVPRSEDDTRHSGKRDQKEANEYELWLSDICPGDENVYDPVTYRYGQRIRYPRLSRMTLDFLTIQAMPAECERLFSAVGQMGTATHTRVDANTIELCQVTKSSGYRRQGSYSNSNSRGNRPGMTRSRMGNSNLED
ncbi:hypothetical protein FHL15_009300 [Xylaria flabelliformis]|uniref:HAT C-terminal dimerisation domain-containing protein n=1 Tax=Xylaria flabelliformis TaxID=2512241 RepID=A0A553HPJ9_9PEZI|nr:hypothetical protein FHL15_009300 [Xylaria flabelliformis]